MNQLCSNFRCQIIRIVLNLNTHRDEILATLATFGDKWTALSGSLASRGGSGCVTSGDKSRIGITGVTLHSHVH